MSKDQQQISKGEARLARQLIRTLKLLKSRAPRMSVTDVMVLLSIALDDDWNYRSHAERTDINKAAMNKIAMRLGEKTVYGAKGSKWIEERPDPEDGRGKVPYLTPTGRGFVELLLERGKDDDGRDDTAAGG